MPELAETLAFVAALLMVISIAIWSSWLRVSAAAAARRTAGSKRCTGGSCHEVAHCSLRGQRRGSNSGDRRLDLSLGARRRSCPTGSSLRELPLPLRSRGKVCSELGAEAFATEPRPLGL